MSSTPRHLVIACGGTGGHFFPALSIGMEFRRQGGRVTFLVSGHHAGEHRRLAEGAGFEAAACPAIRLPAGAGEALLFPWRFGRALWAARRELRRLRPDLLLGMGSFASVPAGLAAAFAGVPLFLHEGNTRTGRANRLLARRARLLCTSFPEQLDAAAIRCPCRWTGFPLRQALVDAAARPMAAPEAYLAQGGLAAGLPVLLVFGGSQGARFINGLMAETAARLGAETCHRFQLLHFTGQEDNRDLTAAYARCGLRAWVKPSESDMAAAYQAAGLAVCRAGGATISELALFGKPAVFIPLPSAADDHQTSNARCVVSRGGGLLVPQAEAGPERLADLLRLWLSAPGETAVWGERIRTLAAPAAAANVVRELLA